MENKHVSLLEYVICQASYITDSLVTYIIEKVTIIKSNDKKVYISSIYYMWRLGCVWFVALH